MKGELKTWKEIKKEATFDCYGTDAIYGCEVEIYNFHGSDIDEDRYKKILEAYPNGIEEDLDVDNDDDVLVAVGNECIYINVKSFKE